MVKEELSKLLVDVKEGRITIEEALARLKNLPYEDLGFARLDHHRALRKGFPEAIFCQGKTVEQIAQIFSRLCQGRRSIIATRATREAFDRVREIYPDAVYNELARTIVINRGEEAGHRVRCW